MITVFKINDEIRESINIRKSYKSYFENSSLFLLHNKSFLRKKI